jgi:hypothetical protein
MTALCQQIISSLLLDIELMVRIFRAEPPETDSSFWKREELYLGFEASISMDKLLICMDFMEDVSKEISQF